MKENLLIKGLIKMLKGFIILLLIVVLIIIVYLIPAWIPVKYAVKEYNFNEYKNYILVKENSYTGAPWLKLGDDKGFYNKNNIYEVWLEGEKIPIITSPTESDNIYLCEVDEKVGEVIIYNMSYEKFKVINWYPVYPIKRETVILPGWLYPAGFLNKYDFEAGIPW